MIERRFRGALGLLVMGLLASSVWPGEAAGSPKFSLGLLGGLGLPESSLIDASAPADVAVEPPNTAPDNFVFLKQRASVALGARLDCWLTSRIGVEAEVSLLPSKGDLRAAFFDPTDESVTFGLVSAEAKSLHVGFLLNYAIVQPALDPILVYLTGGLGATRRSGELYSDLLELEVGTEIGPVLGLGVRYGISRGLALRADLRDYISSYDPKLPDFIVPIKSRTQHDLMLNAGLDFILTQ